MIRFFLADGRESAIELVSEYSTVASLLLTFKALCCVGI